MFMVVIELQHDSTDFVGPFEDQEAAELWTQSIPPDPAIISAWLHPLTPPAEMRFTIESPTTFKAKV